MSNVILAPNAGFCFGVKRAVDEAIKTEQYYNKIIYTLGPLIHNNDVVNMLKEKNIWAVEPQSVCQLNSGDVIIIRSHGVSKNVLNELVDRGLKVIDATCPYVSNIHRIVEKYFNKGYKIIIVGDSTHPEVIGINGWCENSAIITKDGSDIVSIPERVCVVSQTTEKQENYEKVISTLAKKSKEIVALNTICSATEIRQSSAEELSKKVDAVVVIGGYNSSNTTKLFEICKKNCDKTIHVENSRDIPDEILKNKKIGVTAGASTPEWIIREAISKMNNGENLEMNEQLAFMEQNDKKISVGDVLTGQIISVNENEAFVNLGYKADGILPKNEVTKEDVSLTGLFNIGDSIEVKVINRRNEDGYVVLSRIELERETAFKEIKNIFENNTTITVKVKQEVKGGVSALYKRIRIFIPASHMELHHVDSLSSYVGKDLDIKIIEFKEERRSTKIIGSRRELLKAEQKSKEEDAFNKLEAGQVIEGEVKRLTDFGAFIDVMGVDGLLHVSEISYGRVEKPADVLKVGQKVNVYVLSVDKENKKVSLSIKKLVEDPWKNVEQNYPVGNVVLGKVARFANFGAFVELEPGVDGLVHISQISTERINKPSDVLQIGQQVKAKIVDVDKENKKIGLSIKEVEEQ